MTSPGKLNTVVSYLLCFLFLEGTFLGLELLASAELLRYKLSFLCVQLSSAISSCRVVFGLEKELFQFLFDSDEFRAC